MSKAARWCKLHNIVDIIAKLKTAELCGDNDKSTVTLTHLLPATPKAPENSVIFTVQILNALFGSAFKSDDELIMQQ